MRARGAPDRTAPSRRGLRTPKSHPLTVARRPAPNQHARGRTGRPPARPGARCRPIRGHGGSAAYTM
eukprot:4829286-Prymnesium_polylepis.1